MTAFRRAALVALLAALVFVVGCSRGSEQIILQGRYEAQPSEKVRLLFDLVHAYPQVPGGHLDKNSYGYYEITSWHSLLKAMTLAGVSSDLMVKGEITSSLLENYQLFCLFYPEHPAPPLSEQEIEALERWVRAGGGLMVVGEHHNIRHSSERLNPLLQRFGIQLSYGCVIDDANAFASGSWHKCFDFAEHPASHGVRAVAVRTATAIEFDESHPDRPRGLMASSPTAFLDDWDPKTPAFLGDYARQPEEPEGRFYEMAAASPGQGRVIVVGDHNMFDNLTLRYVDNLKLALQSWNWLAGEALRLPVNEPETKILVPETTRPSDIMNPDATEGGQGAFAFYTFFTVLNRHPDTIAHCSEFFDSDYSAVLVVPQPNKFARPYLDYLVGQQQKGASIVIMVDATTEQGEGTKQVLQEFDLSLDLPAQKSLRKTGDLVVGDQTIGSCTLEVLPWEAKAEEKVLMKFVTDDGEYPIIVELSSGIQVVLQAQLFRSRAFQSNEGYNLPREGNKPNQDGQVVYQALWAWLDDLHGQASKL